MIGQTVTHYQIQARLGAGGMGAVYKALDTKLERTVALKFLAPQIVGNADARQRFLREARAAAALSHSAICTVHEIDEIDGQVFIAMQYLEGRSLAERIRAGPLPVNEAADIASQVAEGLGVAHRKGFIHRDIKPANIMITPTGRAVILDFGLVRSLDATRQTTAGVMIGTTAYLAPEQARGDAVDQRADIWALGIVLYEMLAGKRPFQGEIDQATIYQILHEEPQAIVESVPDTPPLLSHVIARALAKDPDTRYQKIYAMLEDLRSSAAPLEPGATTDPHVGSLRIPSIAVLPFANLTGDPEREYLCDGLAEELINILTTIRPLKVVARTSSFVFKGRTEDIRLIGKALDVASVLEGSVRIEDDRIRVTVQLVDAHDGYHLWSQRFDRELTDVFALQDEIALATVSFLKRKLLGQERDALLKRYTDDLEAYQAYLKGRYFYMRMSREDFQTAGKYYHEAITRDPTFALPHIGLSGIYGFAGSLGYVPHREALARSKPAMLKALELDDSLARAHAGLSMVLVGLEWDWEGARRELERAQQLDPAEYMIHFSGACLHWMRGDLDEAIKCMTSWARIDPLSVLQMAFMTTILIEAGRRDDARKQMAGALEIAPFFDKLHWYLGKINVLDGCHEEALACMRKAVELSNRSPGMLAGLGWALAVAGQDNEACEILAELNSRAETEYVRPFELIKVHAALGQMNEAFACLDRAYEGRDDMLAYCRTDPALFDLHADPRWADFVARMKYPEVSQGEA